MDPCSLDLDLARRKLKLINDFKEDLRHVELANFLMDGCREDPLSFDLMKSLSPYQEMKIEYVPEWLENIDMMITVIDPETGAPTPIYDPATFYCHKLLW